METTTNPLNMHKAVIAKAMESMGWDIDCDIPMANEENRSILKELELLMEERSELVEFQQQTEQRVEKLLQHSKNAEGSINHNLKLLNAYQSQLRTEAHLYKLAEGEHSKLKRDIKDLDRETIIWKQYVDNTEKELCKRHARIDDMTSRIKWAKTALVEWKQAMDDSHKGTKLIERYFKEDQRKIYEEDLRRKSLQIEIDKKRKQLIELNDEQRTLEHTLESTANLYRSAHLERRQMVETWKAAVNVMMNCENSITKGEMELLDLKRESKRKADEQRRCDQKLNTLIENNRQVEAIIEDLNIETSEIKDQIQKITDNIALKENEVDILQKELQGLANRVQLQRLENRKHEQEKKDKLAELETFEEKLEKLKQRLKSVDDKKINAEQRLNVLEEMTDVESKACNELGKETERINGLIFRSREQLMKLNDEEKCLKLQYEGFKVSIAAVTSTFRKTEKELMRQTEIHYSMAFKCLQMERRILKLQGGIIDPEIEEQNQIHLAKLEEEHVLVTRRLQATEAENKKLDDNMRKVTLVFNEDVTKVENMMYIIKESQSYCEGGLQRLKQQKQQNKVLIVDLSLLKMRAHDFENEIEKCNKSSYSLNTHRIKLNRIMKDRMVEIKCQMDLLREKLKHLQEERSTLRADIGERNKHIEAVQARFELTAELLGTNEDGTLVTATQLKVENVQQKQLLLDQGDALNAKVLKAEEEIKAMENTLLLLNDSNDKYRRTAFGGCDAEEDHIELKSLQANYCKALHQLKALRSKLFRIEQSNDQATSYKESLEVKLENETRNRLENSEVLAKLQKEIDLQQEKLQRAERDMKNALKTLKAQNLDPEFLESYERDLDLRELEYRNSKAVSHLTDAAETEHEIGPKIIRLLIDRGIKLPHQLQRSQSFASWRSENSEMSLSSSKDVITTRSSVSEMSQLQPKMSSAKVSVVSIDFQTGK